MNSVARTLSTRRCANGTTRRRRSPHPPRPLTRAPRRVEASAEHRVQEGLRRPRDVVECPPREAVLAPSRRTATSTSAAAPTRAAHASNGTHRMGPEASPHISSVALAVSAAGLLQTTSDVGVTSQRENYENLAKNEKMTPGWVNCSRERRNDHALPPSVLIESAGSSMPCICFD